MPPDHAARSTTLDNTSRNATLLFVLLTHPHLDHFQGLASVVHRHGQLARRVCLFQGVTELEIAQLFSVDSLKASAGVRAYRFYEKYGALLKMCRQELTEYQLQSVGDGTVLCSVDLTDASGRTATLRVTCLSPSRLDTDYFLAQVRIHNLFDVAMGRKAALRQTCNRVRYCQELWNGPHDQAASFRSSSC